MITTKGPIDLFMDESVPMILDRVLAEALLVVQVSCSLAVNLLVFFCSTVYVMLVVH